MRVYVCVKHVPDTAANIKVVGGSGFDESVKFIVNPYDDRGIKISRAIVSVLKKAGVNFAIFGDEERCNGNMARRCGNEYLAQMMIQENVEVLNQYKPKKILTGCPHCFNTIKNEYPQFGADYEVVHHTDFILELLNQGRLKTSGRESKMEVKDLAEIV